MKLIQLKSTVTKSFANPSGADIISKVSARMENPIIDLINEEIHFQTVYSYEESKVIREFTPADDSLGIGELPELTKQIEVIISKEPSVLEKEEVEALFQAIGIDIDKNIGFFDGLKTNFHTAFEYSIKNDGYFGLTPNDWEVIS